MERNQKKDFLDAFTIKNLKVKIQYLDVLVNKLSIELLKHETRMIGKEELISKISDLLGKIECNVSDREFWR